MKRLFQDIMQKYMHGMYIEVDLNVYIDIIKLPIAASITGPIGKIGNNPDGAYNNDKEKYIKFVHEYALLFKDWGYRILNAHESGDSDTSYYFIVHNDYDGYIIDFPISIKLSPHIFTDRSRIGVQSDYIREELKDLIRVGEGNGLSDDEILEFKNRYSDDLEMELQHLIEVPDDSIVKIQRCQLNYIYLYDKDKHNCLKFTDYIDITKYTEKFLQDSQMAYLDDSISNYIIDLDEYIWKNKQYRLAQQTKQGEYTKFVFTDIESLIREMWKLHLISVDDRSMLQVHKTKIPNQYVSNVNKKYILYVEPIHWTQM